MYPAGWIDETFSSIFNVTETKISTNMVHIPLVQTPHLKIFPMPPNADIYRHRWQNVVRKNPHFCEK
jgi:hypothetical protein